LEYGSPRPNGEGFFQSPPEIDHHHPEDGKDNIASQLDESQFAAE